MKQQHAGEATTIAAIGPLAGMGVDAAYDRRPSILLLCDEGEEALAGMAEASGARLLGSSRLSDAMERLDGTATARLLILKITVDHPELPRLLARIDSLMDADNALVIVPPALLDMAYAALASPRVELLCDPSAGDVEAAIALGLRPSRTALHDVGRENEAMRLQQLQEEVSRIARVLAGLSGRADAQPPLQGAGGALNEPGRTYAGEPLLDMPARARGAPPVSAREIREMLRLRRLRDQFFPEDLFADPAWDMLLDLMAARLSGQRVSVSSLCIAAAVPATTALRWIRALTDNGLFLRQADPADGRRVFIALSDGAADAMTNYFIAAKRGGRTMMA